MEERSSLNKAFKINRFLPYWAVFQADVKQTLQSWIYRVWVLLSVGAAMGYLLYRFGARQVAGMVQPAPEMLGDLMSWTVLVSVTLIIVLTAGTICSERGTMADSVLSRGISRFQYFLGKWHARLALVLVTFLLLSALTLVGARLLLHSQDLSLKGCLAGLTAVSALLVLIITCGVSISAVANSTLVSIGISWLVLYGTGFVLSLMPTALPFPTPDRVLHGLPQILRNNYDGSMLNQLMLVSLTGAFLAALAGMAYFSRRDV